MTRPSPAELAGRVEQLLEAVGRVGVVDDDRERLAGVDDLEPAGQRAVGGRGRATIVGLVDAELGGRGLAAASAFDDVEARRRAGGDRRWPRQREPAAVGARPRASVDVVERVADASGSWRASRRSRPCGSSTLTTADVR